MGEIRQLPVHPFQSIQCLGQTRGPLPDSKFQFVVGPSEFILGFPQFGFRLHLPQVFQREAAQHHGKRGKERECGGQDIPRDDRDLRQCRQVSGFIKTELSGLETECLDVRFFEEKLTYECIGQVPPFNNDGRCRIREAVSAAVE